MSSADASRSLRHLLVRDLVLRCKVGVHARERLVPQRIRLNLDLGICETDDPADELAAVVDYEALIDRIRSALATGHVNLIETLAGRVADLCLDDPRVALVRVRVEKLDAIPGAIVGVEIERRQAGSSI